MPTNRHRYYDMEAWIRVGFKCRLLSKMQSSSFLQKNGFPTYQACEYAASNINWEKIEKFIDENKPLIAVICLEEKKNHLFGVTDLNSIKEKCLKLTNIDFRLMLFQEIKTCEESYVGTAISNGRGEGVLEILNELTTNVQELTSRGCNPEDLFCVWFHEFGKIVNFTQKPYPCDTKEIKEIISLTSRFNGYFEFARGRIRKKEGIFFTDYQNDPIFYDWISSMSM